MDGFTPPLDWTQSAPNDLWALLAEAYGTLPALETVADRARLPAADLPTTGTVRQRWKVVINLLASRGALRAMVDARLKDDSVEAYWHRFQEVSRRLSDPHASVQPDPPALKPGPNAVLALAGRLVDFATIAHQAIWRGGVGVVDPRAVESLIAIGTDLLGVWTSRKAGRLKGITSHGALVCAAFTVALRECQSSADDPSAREAELGALLADGLLTSSPAGGWDYGGLLLGSPLRSPVYLRLKALSTEAGHVQSGDEELFASTFRLVWAQLFGSDAGRTLREAIKDGPFEQGAMLKRQIAEDLVSWRANHVFGNLRTLRRGDARLPLERLYVEPCVKGSGRPILEALARWLKTGARRIALVTASFGRGKSLTARMLASLLADAWLDSPAGERGRLPVFINCAEHLHSNDLGAVTVRALNAQLETAYGRDAATTDEVPWAHDSSRLLYILDGLDEKSLSSDATDRLLGALDQDRAGRYVIFARPNTVPNESMMVLRFPLLDFDDRQIDVWLRQWNLLAGDAIARRKVEERGLRKLCRVPLLLYMVARIWHELKDDGVQEIDVYEQFFRLLAATKVKPDGGGEAVVGGHHKAVRGAAEAIFRKLLDQDILPDDATPTDALLWLLARLAWESKRREAIRKKLTLTIVRRVLKELGLRDVTDKIVSGLTSVMETSGEALNLEMSFSHKSFSEYLVACHWRNQLTREDFDEAELMGARLADPESEAVNLLVSLLNTRTDDAGRERAISAAERGLIDARLGWRNRQEPCRDPSDDERCYVREVLLAVVCEVRPKGEAPTYTLPRTDLLRGIAAVIWLKGDCLRLRARQLKANGVSLARLPVERGADLRGVVMRRADLSRIELRRADMRGAFIFLSDLQGADLRRTDLTGAKLRQTNLRGADLRSAVLERAELPNAFLGRADLSKCTADNAILTRAKLPDANLRAASFVGADFAEADLTRADLRNADLAGANLWKANLTGAALADDSSAVRNLHLALNLDAAIRPEGWGDLLPSVGQSKT